MIDYLVRFLKRFVVLVPGLIMAYVAFREVYPFFDRRLGIAFALLLTYIVTAYILIPAAIRVVRLFIKPKHIPLYSVTPDGFVSDPINVALVGTRQEVIRSMEKAGWHLADPMNPRNLLRMGLALIRKRPYLTAPFSNLYLMGRSQDMGFELPVGANLLHRHHVRFWAVAATADPKYQPHVAFWRKHHKQTLKDRYLWIGAASLDQGFGIIRHNAQITHMIHHDTDAERELIVRQLKDAGSVKRTKLVRLGDPYKLVNRVWTGYLKTDGVMKIVDLAAAKS